MITPRQLEILQYALGADKYGRIPNPLDYAPRNSFCAGWDDVPDCAELVAIGLMRSFRREWLPYFNCIVTDEGRRVMREQSPIEPKLTRSQKRYRRFLNWTDAYQGTFREFLSYEKEHRYADAS